MMFHSLASIESDFIPILAIGGGLSIAVIAILGGLIRSVLVNRDLEKSRREIAAYVAEGSMSPEDAKSLRIEPGKGLVGQLLCINGGRQPAEGSLRSFLVVFAVPALDLRSGMSQAGEPVLVQAFVP